MATNNDFVVKNGLLVKTTATILSTLASTSTLTGALVVSGGVGIGGNLNVGGNLNISVGLPPSYIADAKTQTGSAGTTITINVPAGTIDGDVLVLFVTSANSGATWTTPAGWTAGTSAVGAKVFYRTASSEPASYTITQSVSTTADGYIANFRNASIDVVGAFSGSGTNPAVAPSITVTNNNSLVIAVFSDATGNETYSTPTGFTPLDSDSDATGPSSGIFYKTGVSAGAFGTVSSTMSGGTSRGALISLAPFSNSITAGPAYLTGVSYVNNAQILTTATLSSYGVTTVTAGTDTAVSITAGAVTVWNSATLQTITNRGFTTTNAVNITNTSASTSTNTGALTVAGGVGIGGNLNVGGIVTATSIYVGPWAVSTGSAGVSSISPYAGIFTSTNTTSATSTQTGALQVAGGVGIGKDLYVGGNIYGNLLFVNGAQVLTTATLGLTGNAFTRLTSNTTATMNYNYIADTTGGAFTVTLPASPALGAWVKIVDGGNWAVNNLTVASNGSNIEGVVQDVLIDASGIELLFVYDGTSNGWQVSTTLGQQGYTGSQGKGLQLSGTTSSNALLPTLSSTSTGSAYLISTSTHIWVWNGSSWIDNGSLAGYVGSQGSTGYTGSASTATGPQGIMGYAGSQGISGYIGSVGYVGSAGTTSIITNTSTNASTGYLTFVTTTSGISNVFVDSLGGPRYVPSTDTLTVPGTFIQSNLPLVVNDISNQFNGKKAVFNLKIDQSTITNTIVDSKNVEVVVNGRRLAPYITEQRYPWITPYDSYKGFRIKNNQLIIYNVPNIGSQAVVTIVNSSATKQVRKYPYSATTIALGD